MKTAGYDVTILINESLLNQISGALFYSGFLTANGSVDFYNGKISVKNNIQNFQEELSTTIKDKVPAELRRFLKLDFRFKPTYEPTVDFLADQKIRIGVALRIYLWFWEGLEIKFDASLFVKCGISILEDGTATADFANSEVEEFIIKYNGGMEQEATLSLNDIFTKAIHLYFSGKAVSFELQLPSLEDHIPGIKVDENNPKDKFNIYPKSIKAVSPTTMVLAANVYEDHNFGKSDDIYEFVKNCNLGVAISETAMFKVFNYYWERLESKTFRKDGWFEIKKLDDFFTSVNDITLFIEKFVSKALTLGFIESQTTYKGMDFYYDLNVNFKNQPKFDLIGGNKIKVYNMAFDFSVRIACYCTVENKVVVDTSGFIPDSWTPWDDDKVISRTTTRLKLFDGTLRLNNLELKEGIGKVEFDEVKQSFVGKLEKIDLYWNFIDSGCPFLNLPEKLVNWVFDQFEGKIAEKIPPFVLSPSLKFNVPIIPWKVNLEGKKLEITDSEAIAGVNATFSELKTDLYPVPKYIANINNVEVHKLGCDSVMDTYETHQRGYHLLNDAINAGFDGCKKCLPVYHKK
jgi:hypothetical protein